jgi:hypothetical protein
MTTGAEFAYVVNKRLMGFEDFGPRLVDYLRELNRVTVDTLFDQGSFNEKIPLVAGGANQVRINLKPTELDGLVHDGYGHVLDLEQIMSGGFRNELFENTAAVLYDVGATFCAAPSGIQINPRTGKPEFIKLIESIGDEKQPDLVTDNGGVNITFRVNSLVNSLGGESFAGRQVRVFKKIPGAGATTESVAIETLTVVFSGGNNTVTTVGKFGQDTISTLVSDYTVQLVGLSIRRQSGPQPITGTGKHFYIGTVTGNGGTPVTLTNATQKLISTSILSLTGASQIGTDTSQFTTSQLSGGDDTDEGGLGIPGDPDDPINVQLALRNADRRHVARRPFSAVFAPPTTRRGDDVSGNVNAIQSLDDGGRYLARDYSTAYALTHASGKLGVPVNAANPRFPELTGGSYKGNPGGTEPVRVVTGSGATAHGLRGRYRRLGFAGAPGKWWIDTADLVGGVGSNAHFEDCRFDWGDTRFGAGGVLPGADEPSDFKNCVFGPQGSNRAGLFTGVHLGNQFGENHPWMVFDQCLFKASPTIDGPVLQISQLGINNTLGSIAPWDGRPLVFRNCIFDSTGNVGFQPTVVIGSNRSLVAVFENCVFRGHTGQLQPVVYMSGQFDKVSFRGCYFLAKEGQALWGPSRYGEVVDCYVESGTGTAVTSPRLVLIGGASEASFGKGLGPVVRNLMVNIQRTSQTAPSGNQAVVQLGGSGQIDVDGLFIAHNAATLPNYPVLACFGVPSTETTPDLQLTASFRNITVDLNNAVSSVATLNPFGGNYEPCHILLAGAPSAPSAAYGAPAHYQNVVIRRWGIAVPAADNGVAHVCFVKAAVVNGFRMLQDNISGSPPANGYKSLLGMGNWNIAPSSLNLRTMVTDFFIATGVVGLCPMGFIYLGGDNCSIHRGTLAKYANTLAPLAIWATGQSLIRFGQDIAFGGGGGHCTVDDVMLMFENAIANTLGPIVTCPRPTITDYCAVVNSQFVWNGNGATTQRQVSQVISASTSANFMCSNNRFRTDTVAGNPDVVNLQGVRSMFWGNILQGNAGTAPSFTNSGAGSIGGNTHNAISA